MSSDPEDYERAFWSRRQVQMFRKARSGVFLRCHSVPLQIEETEPKKPNFSTTERSSTELRFASFPRSIVRDPGRLSRVKINALGGALIVTLSPRDSRPTDSNSNLVVPVCENLRSGGWGCRGKGDVNCARIRDAKLRSTFPCIVDVEA